MFIASESVRKKKNKESGCIFKQSKIREQLGLLPHPFLVKKYMQISFYLFMCSEPKS